MKIYIQNGKTSVWHTRKSVRKIWNDDVACQTTAGGDNYNHDCISLL